MIGKVYGRMRVAADELWLDGLGAWIVALEFTGPCGGIGGFGDGASCIMVIGYGFLISRSRAGGACYIQTLFPILPLFSYYQARHPHSRTYTHAYDAHLQGSPFHFWQ